MMNPAIVRLSPILKPRYLFKSFATISRPPDEAFMLKSSACPKLITTIKQARSITVFPDNDSGFGVTSSKTQRYKGSNNEVSIVFAPNSFPIKMQPHISSTTFRINVNVDTFKGIKFTSTSTSPDRLPNTRFAGIII